MSSEGLLETTETLACIMSDVDASDVSDIEKTDCLYVPLGLLEIESGLGEGLILVFPGSKFLSGDLQCFCFGGGVG